MIFQRLAAIAAVTCMIAACASSSTEEATGDVAPMDTAVTDTSVQVQRADTLPTPTPEPAPAPAPTPTDTAAAQPSMTGSRWTGTLSPTPAAMGDTTVGTGITGNVTVAPGDAAGSTKAELSVSGLKSGQTYPWHVHSGSCSTGGPIVGPADAYTPITVAVGTSDASAVIPIPTPTSGEFHVNIHKSPTELAVIIACADLKSGM